MGGYASMVYHAEWDCPECGFRNDEEGLVPVRSTVRCFHCGEASTVVSRT